jgi:transposase, IS5 family
MRKVFDMQPKLFCPTIDQIQIDLNSRDEIPKILMDIQAIFKDKTTCKEIFKILANVLSEKDGEPTKKVDPRKGRPGMDQWTIFVLGMLRLNCNIDCDKLHELANQHKNLRMMLGHEVLDDKRYSLQTIKDNVRLLDRNTLDEINVIAVNFGHQKIIAGHKLGSPLKGSCDSFVLETDVHFPTDISLCFDAVRKSTETVRMLCNHLAISGWREAKSNIKKVKRQFRKVSKLKKSTSKDENKQKARKQLIKEAHADYVDLSDFFLDKAQETINAIVVPEENYILCAKIANIQQYVDHGKRQVAQIRRRVIDGESIPHEEKVFSIFEEHTEWISKGKAGVPVELGKRVCIVKDQYGFILHHRVMEKETDDKIAVPIILETKEHFPSFNSCSFDKGFHSPANQKALAEILDKVYLPRKGRLSKEAKEIEFSEDFVTARRKHSVVESSVNALENHGFDICRDHGIEGFKRYVALGVVARNLQIIGHMIQQKELKKKRRAEKKYALAA